MAVKLPEPPQRVGLEEGRVRLAMEARKQLPAGLSTVGEDLLYSNESKR